MFLLPQVCAGQLARLFSNRLEADHVLDVVRVLPSLDAAHAVVLLRDLTRVKRFHMVKMFFSDDDLKQIKARTDAVHGAVSTLANGVALCEEVRTLQTDFLS